jgi:dTDP-4-amino-4,6-dideoxygalactose transaminase
MMDSRSYVMGKELEAVRGRICGLLRLNHCVGVGNGLDILYLILRGYGIGEGDEVIFPSNTYIATWLPFLTQVQLQFQSSLCKDKWNCSCVL